MSAPIAKTNLAFQLPNLTYVDARFEEPNLREVTPVEQRHSWLSGRMSAFRAWREKRAALAELSVMSDRELLDIGLSRSDLNRVFDGAHNGDLIARSVG